MRGEKQISYLLTPTPTTSVNSVFIRRLDILNRGFSGYNTTNALDVFPEFIPNPSQATVRFLVIFFGANDACLPGSPTGQYVPLEKYAANLRRLIKTARYLLPGVRIILISPPPVNEYQLEASNLLKWGTTTPTRTAANTKLYADACHDLWAGGTFPCSLQQIAGRAFVLRQEMTSMSGSRRQRQQHR